MTRNWIGSPAGWLRLLWRDALSRPAWTRAADALGHPLRGLSLRMRLALIFASLILVTTIFASLVLYEAHREAVRGADLRLSQSAELMRAVELDDVLADVDRQAMMGEVDALGIAHFRRSLAALGERLSTGVVGLEVGTIRRRFEDYLTIVNRAPRAGQAAFSPEFRISFENVASAVRSLIVSEELRSYRFAQEQRDERSRSIRSGILLLAAFVVLLSLGAMRLIMFVTEPLSVLARCLDEVNVEDDIHRALPRFRWKVPEITRVAESFEQLLYRLRGYRALNVKRLLLEKRRADIVAASISDGIFLLRGEEILYVNPVAERILAMSPGRSWKGASISALAAELTGAQAAGTAGSRRGNAGVLGVHAAISRTIPVELDVEGPDDRKNHYIVRSFPISEEVIERVEHSFDGPGEQFLDRWQATTLVLAQDVTIVKESQEAKAHFVATLAHEVKTPVTSLTMATRLLLKGIDQIPNPTHRTLVQTCVQDVDRLRGLIDDLLSVSRFETLTQRLQVKSVDLGRLLRQSVQHFQQQASVRGVELEMRLPARGGTIHVPADAAKVSWLLSNLLTNAMRHSPRGGKVEVIIVADEEAVEVRIRDTGPGIDRSRQERIFDKLNPFYDLRVARTGSVGIGLAIAREIVVAHGGRIWVTSEPGHGAEFCFTLPRRRGSTGLTGESPLENKMKGDINGTSARG